MQKLWLKDFEHHISVATWNAADDLVQAGRVKALREVEKHFWVASVEDAEGTYEVETVITPHKIKAFTCECWTEGRRLMCAHVAASLLKLRQFLEQKSEEAKAKAEKKAAAQLQRITIGNVMDHATPEALSEFVQEYARRDRDFALALKTWFAGSIEGTENPFSLILESVIPKSLQEKNVREPEFRRLRQTLDDLNRQLLAAGKENNFRVVFQIATAVLQKISPLVSQVESQKQQQLIGYGESALSHLIKLYETEISPELRESAWNAVFDMAERHLFSNEMTVAVLHLLNRDAANEDKFRRISNLFDSVPHPPPPFVLHLFAGALAARQMPEAVVRVLDEYASKPALIKEAILTLAQTGRSEAAFMAGEHFLDSLTFTFSQRREIEDTLFALAKKETDPTRQIKLLWRRFLHGNNFDYFNEMKRLAGRGWPAELKRRLSELRKKGDDNTTAVVLAAEGQKAELAQLLEKQDNLLQFQLYENLFLPEDKNFVLSRYVELLSDHLRHHFGRQASAHVRQSLAGLMQKGETDLVFDIIRQLRVRFEDRPSLPEELAELFPKSKRKILLAE